MSTDAQSDSPFRIPNFSFVDKNNSPSFKAPAFTVGSSDENSETSMQSSKSPGLKFGNLNLSETPETEKVSSPSQLPGHVTPPRTAEGFEFKFGSPQKFEFRFSGVRPRSPTKGPKSPGTPSDSAKEGPDDEVDTSDGEIFFQPVIPLPPKVDMKTGEEEEEVLYCHRAKLFRLDQGEWKERGTGDVKILKDLKTDKIRLLMRREQVLKVCMNHLLPVDLDLKEKGDRTWFWSAVDYAEGSPQPEQLALRFKNHEVAEGFRNGVEDAKAFLRAQQSPNSKQVTRAIKSEDQIVPSSESMPSSTEKSSPKVTPESVSSESGGKVSSIFGLSALIPTTSASFVFGNAGSQSPSAPGTFIFGGSSLSGSSAGTPTVSSPAAKSSSTEEVQVVDEKKSSEEKQNLAQSLKLPSNFFRYEEKDPCSGCRGCNDHQHGAKETALDVQLLFVDEASEEDKVKARHLKLPESFFLYRKRPPCPGCRGCENEDASPKQSVEKEPSQPEKPLLDPYRESNMEPPSARQPASSFQSSPTDGKLTTSPAAVVATTTTVATSVGSAAPKPSVASSFLLGGSVSASPTPEFTFATLAAQNDLNGFAALAAQTPNTSAFNSAGSGPGFVGAGNPVFGKLTTPKENADEAEEVAPSVDVHFDPLVPLPELVEVKTGEEEEVPVFSQRARLYRFDSDTKQWKERGIGDIKILKHSTRCQFRLLLRRDQVLKIACNHLITPTMELNSMSNSNNSLMWSALDFSEGVQVAETFCIRFKNVDILQDFKKTVEECKTKLTSQECQDSVKEEGSNEKPDTESQCHEYDEEEEEDEDENEEQPEWVKNEEPIQGDEDLYYKASEEYEELRHQEQSLGQQEDKSSLPDMAALNVCDEDQEDTEHLYHSEELDEEEEEEDEEDGDDCEQLFEKRITLAEAPLGSRDYKILGMGTLRVLYDDEVYGSRIQVKDDEMKLMCDHIVAIQTCLRVVDKEATWSVIDMALPQATRRQFKAIFSSLDAVQEFQKVFDEAKNFAVTSEILENEDPAPNFS